MTARLRPVFSLAFSDDFQRWEIADDGVSVAPEALTPGSATALEQELARLSAYLDDIDPSIVATIWDAWRAPAAILPWLAWAMSVDVWDDAWPEIVKREAIAGAPAYHRIKGTWSAVEQMLALARRPYTITEWFETVPRGRRGTASVHVEADLDQVADILGRVKPLVMAAKAKTRAIAFGVGDVVSGEIGVAAACVIDEIVDVAPYAFSVQHPEGALVAAYAALIEETTIIGAA